MSEPSNQNSTQTTSILLPDAAIAVFSKDGNTLKTATSLKEDWRFARVVISAHEGDVETAIASFADKGSPDLIIIQTDTIDDSFSQRLGALAEHCDEGTSAIVIGPDNDVNLYRKLIDMGVSDYLVRPVEAPVLAEVIAKSLIDKLGVTGSRLIAVIGAKGGVGASVLAEALACGTSDILKRKTMLLDTAGGWSTLSVGMGFEPSTTLAEAVKAAENNDSDSLKRMIHIAGPNLSVLATGGDVMLEHSVTTPQLEELIDMIMARYPIVIADISQSPEDMQRTVISRASQIILVSTPTLPALRLARTLIHEIKDVRGGNDKDVSLLINMQGMGGKSEVSKADIEAAMERSVAAFLPFEPKMFLGNESESKKLTDDKEARVLIEETLLPILKMPMPNQGAAKKEETGLLGGLLGKLSSKGK